MDKSMIDYKLKRRLRRILPFFISNFLMEKNLIIKKRLYDPVRLADDFLFYFTREVSNLNFQDKTVLEIGYGGLWGLGCQFLQKGFSKVILLDPYSPIRRKKNNILFSQYPEYFINENPNPKYFEIVKENLEIFAEKNRQKINFIVSNSVLEHVKDVERLVESSYFILKENGMSVHKIDLRDHYFKYPFHMLNFSKKEWKKLNPPTNLNRLRYWDYTRIFSKYFKNNQIIIREQLPNEYQKNSHRIHPDFDINSEYKTVTKLTVVSKT